MGLIETLGSEIVVGLGSTSIVVLAGYMAIRDRLKDSENEIKRLDQEIKRLEPLKDLERDVIMLTPFIELFTQVGSDRVEKIFKEENR